MTKPPIDYLHPASADPNRRPPYLGVIAICFTIGWLAGLLFGWISYDPFDDALIPWLAGVTLLIGTPCGVVLSAIAVTILWLKFRTQSNRANLQMLDNNTAGNRIAHSKAVQSSPRSARRTHLIAIGCASAIALGILLMFSATSSRKQMDKYDAVVQLIAKQTGTQFRPASKEAIEQLYNLEFPDALVAFYAKHEPAECAEGVARLWPISDVVRENTEYVPGKVIVPYGYRVFASTFGGDAYCFNLNSQSDGEPEIVLISHEDVGEDSTADEVHRAAKWVARNLIEFLVQFEKDTTNQGSDL